MKYTNGCVVIRYNGFMYKIPKAPFETEERALDRAWYIAKHCDSSLSQEEVISRSFIWANEKYFGMIY